MEVTAGWGRLEKTALWNMARRSYMRDAWRIFHAFPRVRRLYGHAADTYGFSYCPSLDKAILCRSVVLSHPEPFRASAAWLDERLPVPDAVACRLILSTRHCLPDQDNRLILLELADYTDPDTRSKMLETQLAELERRFPTASDGVRRERLVVRLSNILRNLRIGMELGRIPSGDLAHFRSIHSGLESALACLSAGSASDEQRTI